MAEEELFDPLLRMPVKAQFVQPFQATKIYVCPYCNREIPARTGHFVVVPTEAPDLRRHWHKHCWNRAIP